MWPLLPLLLIACQPEVDIPYQGDDALTLGAHAIRVDGQRVLTTDGQLLADHVYTPPVASTTHLCAADEATDGLGQLRCWDADLHPIQLAVGGRPGRLAIRDGMVAWVASPEGLPQVFVAPIDGSAPPRALTNVGLKRVLGQAPEGWVPPPLRQSLHFDGDYLRWDAPEGPQSVKWR